MNIPKETSYFLLLALIMTSLIIEAREFYSGSEQVKKRPLRYAIVNNKVLDPGQTGNRWRRVTVLVEPSAFSEELLEQVLNLISKRFPQPDWLEVDVKTSLKQIKTPEEEDLGEVSEEPDDVELRQYHWGLLVRKNGNEFFRYNSFPPNRMMKTVVLKGKDIYLKK